MVYRCKEQMKVSVFSMLHNLRAGRNDEPFLFPKRMGTIEALCTSETLVKDNQISSSALLVN